MSNIFLVPLLIRGDELPMRWDCFQLPTESLGTNWPIAYWPDYNSAVGLIIWFGQSNQETAAEISSSQFKLFL